MRHIIFGAGGFGREIARLARFRSDNVVFSHDGPEGEVMGMRVMPFSDRLSSDIVTIALGNPLDRKTVFDRHDDVVYGNILSPTSLIGDNVEIGDGFVLCDYTIITSTAKIGKHFQCNIYSYVAHDCVIGDFVTFAPRVSCNGRVYIEDGAYIGTGVTIREGTADNPIIIGKGAVVGMGAVVTKSVPAMTTVVGNPARPL